ncbi:MAG: threonine synthase [Bacillota bacterium]|uniref:Pyridoxal-5'-phosphate-dependent protein subunit beta n=1 Tax=Cytobacillus oceanisediminis 2691 TaxID=1196031 RepID=A0A160MHT1_9BACI|nr:MULTISPECIES: pyridoxal-phosphate dependent enzyme [Bacillaceae]AND42966.1 pyridoxal-5'-phosphate-dependent protein subunit beta [Cytobacillus oceanisediminis 2691]MCM3244659.1 pyridoxal-phosphate dependent enzyme [Cytobacillus oceanisediminis]USK47486.1 pyridoxal-phosphate dependent enzyme [Cytobacillus oceanisediminis]
MGIVQTWNNSVKVFECIKCNQQFSPNDYFTGCPVCLKKQQPSSLKFLYEQDMPWKIDKSAKGMFRYADRLPYKTFPTLGEGETPIISMNGLEKELGIPEIWLKNEGQNPTGSHKDRMSPLIVARAASLNRSTVIAASSGNAGASLAAYAAAAGLRCKIVTTPKINGPWEKAIRLSGAEIIKVQNSLERWETVRKLVEEEGDYPATNYNIPPVGSNMFGVQGYTTVAYEIVEQLRECQPTAVIIPCARGDLLWGIWEGFVESLRLGWIESIPRLYAVEPFPRLAHVLQGRDYRGEFRGDSRLLPSIGGETVTYQSLDAIKSSRGDAIVVTNTEVEKAQWDLAKRGIFAEGSAAITWPAVSKLVKTGKIDENDRVLLMITSHGFKGV